MGEIGNTQFFKVEVEKETSVKIILEMVFEAMIEKGYDPALGARPLRRVVQEFIEDPLADIMLAGKTKPRMRAKLAKDGKSLKF